MSVLDVISRQLTEYVTDGDTDIREKETIEYGIYMFFSETVKIIAVVSIAAMAGRLKDTLIIMAVLGLLRNYMGGVHAKTQWGCFLSYTATVFLIYCGGNYLYSYMASSIILLLLPPVLWAVGKYAPADTEFKPLLSSKMTRKYRIYSLVLVVACYAAFIVFPAPYKYYIGFSVIAEGVLILPITYKLYKIKYGKEVAL